MFRAQHVPPPRGDYVQAVARVGQQGIGFDPGRACKPRQHRGVDIDHARTPRPRAQRHVQHVAKLGQRFALERILYRLSQSEHAERFVLKGALLFTLWYDMPHRATRDADLLGFGVSDLDSVAQTFRDKGFDDNLISRTPMRRFGQLPEPAHALLECHQVRIAARPLVKTALAAALKAARGRRIIAAFSAGAAR